MNISTGSIVRLKSGGPEMTVRGNPLNSNGSGFVNHIFVCNWFEDGVLKEESFMRSQLTMSEINIAISNNAEDAKTVVTEIEQIIETKITEKKEVLATKEDLLKLQIDIEKRFNQLIIWIVATSIGLTGVIIAVAKL